MQYWSTQNNYSPPHVESALGRGIASFLDKMGEWEGDAAPVRTGPIVDGWERLKRYAGFDRAARLTAALPDMPPNRLLVVAALDDLRTAPISEIIKRLEGHGLYCNYSIARPVLEELCDAGIVERVEYVSVRKSASIAYTIISRPWDVS